MPSPCKQFFWTLLYNHASSLPQHTPFPCRTLHCTWYWIWVICESWLQSELKLVRSALGWYWKRWVFTYTGRWVRAIAFGTISANLPVLCRHKWNYFLTLLHDCFFRPCTQNFATVIKRSGSWHPCSLRKKPGRISRQSSVFWAKP